MRYTKQKRHEYDKCNICGEYARLTWDHVPPKSVKIAPGAYSNCLFDDKGMPTESRYEKRFQNGVKYRTICEKCNGALLGGYDQDYAEFIRMVNSGMESLAQEAIKPNTTPVGAAIIQVRVKINRILRSIVGHFLSMKRIYDTDTLIDAYLRTYLLDITKRLTDVKLYSWFYPYLTIINVRDVATKGHMDTHPSGFISAMNAFPLAYLLSTKDESICGLDDLGSYSTTDIEDEVTVCLHTDTAYYPRAEKSADGEILRVRRKSFWWPVNISDDAFGAYFVMGNDEIMAGSTIAVQR